MKYLKVKNKRRGEGGAKVYFSHSLQKVRNKNNAPIEDKLINPHMFMTKL